MQSIRENTDGSRSRRDGEGRRLVVLASMLAVVAALLSVVVATGSGSRGGVQTGGPKGAPSTATLSPETGLADPNFFVELHPELRTEPAPSWVHQGTRITYYAIAASVPQSYHRYVEDENGTWVNPQTGKTYRREDIPGAAGHGYNQVTVTARDDAIAALHIHVYGLTGIPKDSPVTTLTWGGAVGYPGAGSDYWLSPNVLAGVDQVVSDSLKVLRMPYTVGGHRYHALWIQSIGDDGNLTWVYDLHSGILLHTASATQGPPITGPVAQGEGREGSTFLTQSTLVDVREPTVPWLDASAPSWVQSISHIEYDGTFSVSVGGGSPIVLDTSVAVDRKSYGTDWARYQFARTMRSNVAPSVTEYAERVDGSGQVGGMWIAPDALARLDAGEVLDHDPETQIDTSVEAVQPTDSGFTVTIRETGAVEVSDLVYDGETGLLVRWSTSNLQLNTRYDYSISSWS